MTTEILHGSQAADVSQITRLIRATRRWLRTSWTVTGLALTIGALAATLVVVALVDLVTPLSEWLRLAGLLLVVLPAGWLAAHGVVRPLVRRLRPQSVARRIEQQLPGIQNRLVSCVDLSSSAGPRTASASFLQRLLAETIERIRPFRPRAIINRRDLERAGLFAAVGLLALAAAYQIFPDRLPTAIARIFAPFADIPPASGVVYTVEPGDANVLRGDDVTFAAIVSQGEPDDLRLEIVAGDEDRPEQTLWYDMQTDDRAANRWTFRLSAFDKSFTYRVHGGGTWSRRYQVTMIDRPRIAGLATVLHYPAYMGIPEPHVNPADVADVSGPVGSQVEVRVAVAGSASAGEIQLLAQRTRAVPVSDRPERQWMAGRVPEGAASEGTWEWDEKAEGGPTHSNPAAPNAVGSHGFHNAATGFQVGRGDVLFAEVYLLPDQTPEAVMLQFHDGQNWERRAYWGADKIPGGQPDTISRRGQGPLPPSGQWVRLEVPARDVDLEGRVIRGVSFTQFGGKCLWRGFGTLPPATRDVKEWVIEQRFPLEPQPADGQSTTPDGEPVAHWAGRFPLANDGWYRVELRNVLDTTNPPMKEARIIAIPDDPPSVAVERPGPDLVLSEPAKVPVFIAAYDDFGLADLVLSVQKGESGGFLGRPVKHYELVTRSDSAVATLDLAAEGISTGQTLRYRVEARDRKGQSAQTPDYSIRIVANDGNAADRRLAAFEQAQDAVQQKLEKLTSDQEEVREKLEQLATKYEPLTQKIEALQREAELATADTPDGQPQPQNPQPPKLDPEAEKMRGELRQELAALVPPERQNAQLGQQTAGELERLAKQASELQTLPPELVRQMSKLAEAFPEAAVKPLQNLATTMQQAAEPARADPQLDDIQAASDGLQRDLELLKSRMEALAAAQKRSRSDAVRGLAELRRELARQDASLAARELAGLRDSVAVLRKELQTLGKDQEQLLEFTPEVPDLLVEDLERKQTRLDLESDSKLADARQLLGNDENRRLRRRTPKRPDMLDADDLLPPEEPDAPGEDNSPAADESPENSQDASQDKDRREMEDEDEPLYLPALGGPRPKLDPKLRPVKQPVKADGDDVAADARRQELGSRQMQRARELSLAEQSLGSDEQSVGELLSELQEALGASARDTSQGSERGATGSAEQPEDGDPQLAATDEPLAEATAELSELLGSDQLREAMAMAARLRQLGQSSAEGPPHQASAVQPAGAAGALTGNLTGTPLGDPVVLQQLEQFDPAARTIILQLQPKVRDELLQGLKQSGPEGYQQFIRDYFRRLAQAQAK